jgi:hypothetical protein
MKKIILLGDSIRMGYDKYVKMALEGEAEVYFPKDNCRFTQYVLRNTHAWVEESGFGADTDLIHWNVGLWDVAQVLGDEPITPIEVYEAYLHRICKRILQCCPKAKVVFATSTPIHQANYESQRNRFWRSNETIRRYNAVAVEVVKQYGFAVNDLYALMEGVPDDFFSDRTHYYTEKATERMTNRVLQVIEEQIGIRGKQLDYAGLFGPSSKDVGM